MYRATSKGKIPSVKNAKSMAQIKTVSQSQSQQHFQPGSAGTIGSSSSETATTTESYRPTSQRLAHVDSFHMFKHSNTPMSGNTNSGKLNNNNKSINSNNISNISNLKASSPTTLRYANLSSSSALSPLNKKNSISSINLQNSGNKSSNNINRSINSQNINNKQKNALSVSSSQNTAPAMSLNSVEPFALDQQIGGNQLSNSQATKVARLNLFDEQPNGQGILEGNKGNNNNSNNLNDINKGKDIQREEEININKKQNWQQQQQQQDYPQTKRVSNQLDGVNEALQSRQSNYDNNINNDADGVISKQERTSYTNYNKDDRTDRQLSSNGNQRQQLQQKQQREQDTNDNNNNIPNGQKDERNNNNSRKDQKDIRENQLDEKDNNNYKQNSKNNNNNGYQQPQNGNSKQPYDQYNNRSQGSQPYQDYDNNSNWGQQYERNRSNNERNPQQYRDNNNNINNTSSNYQSDRLYPPMNGNPRYNNNYNDLPNSFSNDRHNQQYPDSRNIPFNDRNGQYYHDRNSGYDNIPSQGMPFYNGNHDSRSYQNSYHDKGSAYYYDRNNNYGYQGYPSHPADGGYYRHNNNRDGYYQDRDNNNMNGYSNNRGNNDWYSHDRMGDYDTRYPMKQQRYKNSSSDFEQLPHYDDRSYNRYQDDRIDQFKPPSYQNDGFRSQNNNNIPQDRRNINTTKTPPNEMRYVSECFPRTDDNSNTSDRWRPPNAMSYDQFKQQNNQMIMNNSNNINNQLNGSTASSPVPPLSHSQNRASRGEQSQQYPQYYMDKGYSRHNNDINNMNITDQKIIPPQSLPDRSLNKSANGFYEHHRSTPSGGSNYRPGQSPNQRYQGEYEYQHNNWMNNSNNQQHSNSQQPYIQSRDKSPVSRFPPGDRIIMHERSMDRDRERNTPTGANSTNTDRLYSQQFSKREQQQLQDDSVNFKNRSSFQDYSNNNPTGKQVGGSTTTTTTSSRYQQQPDYANFQRKEQGQYAKDYMDLINKNNNNSMQDEPSSQPSKDTQGNPKRSFLKEMPENKPYEQQQQQQQQPQLKEGGGGVRTNSAASALENIKARGNLKSQNDNDGKGIGKQQQQTQHFDDIPVKGMKAGMNFDDMPIKGGKNINNNEKQNFDDMPIKGNKDQPQSYDDIPIKGNNNNKINNNRNLSQNYDDIPINGTKNNNNSNTNKNNYDDIPIKGSTGNQSGFQSERNTPNNQKFMGRAQAAGKRRLETEDGWEGVGDEQAVEEGVGQNNRQVYSREVKTLQSNYDSNDDRPIKPSNQGGKYDLKGIQQQTQQLNNKNSQFNPQSKGGAAVLGQQQQKIDPNVPIPNKKVKLFECREGCGRSFAEESLAKHEGICKKVFQQKRKKFDSAAMRTDIEELKEFQNSYAGTVSKKQNNNPNNKNTNKTSEGSQQKAKWQKQSEALRAVINANKPGAEQQKQDPKAQALMNEALFGEEYVQCNFCNRRFNATAAKRHIPFCEKKAKENHGKVKENVAKGSNGNSIAGNNVGNKMNNNSNSISNVVGIASKVGKKETNVIQTNNNTMNVPRRNIAMNDRKQQY